MIWVLSLSDTELISRALTAVHHVSDIRSLSRFGTLRRALALSVLYLPYTNTTLYQNTFRGERAISGFGWPFTPTHNSSKNFSTFTGSDLHSVLPLLHPGHG